MPWYSFRCRTDAVEALAEEHIARWDAEMIADLRRATQVMIVHHAMGGTILRWWSDPAHDEADTGSCPLITLADALIGHRLIVPLQNTENSRAWRRFVNLLEGGDSIEVSWLVEPLAASPADAWQMILAIRRKGKRPRGRFSVESPALRHFGKIPS